ncbi:MAG: AraC family transcriptional regulator [Paenibacillus sp.]|jgi:AraC-like DNA-binding protein|nr:AraC family transcriptional regulator [Paenibacillus sp.]
MFFQDLRLQNELYIVQKFGALTDHEVHMHDALEISVVLNEEANFRTLKRDYYGQSGDVFLYRPFEPHFNLTRDSSKPVEWIMVLFSPSVIRLIPEGYKLLAPFYAVELYSPFIPSDSVCAAQVRASAEAAVKEERAREPGWQAKQWTCLIDIIVAIYRHYHLYSTSGGAGEEESGHEGIIRSIEYLLSHFAGDVDVEEMIALSGLGKTWFYRSFRRVTGVTPNVFINKLRLQQASSMLMHSAKSVTDIAFECGFHSLSYFNKEFKRFWGVTPREQRRQAMHSRPIIGD